MPAQIIFFPVGNGDMALIKLESGRTILVDCNIRQADDDQTDRTPDVGRLLRDELSRDLLVLKIHPRPVVGTPSR